MRQTTLYTSTSILKLSCYSSLGDWHSQCDHPCMPTSGYSPVCPPCLWVICTLQQKLEAGEAIILMSLHVDVSATDCPPCPSSVRSDCVSALRLIYLGVVRTLSYIAIWLPNKIGRTLRCVYDCYGSVAHISFAVLYYWRPRVVWPIYRLGVSVSVSDVGLHACGPDDNSFLSSY
jgi:hypothetical protein